MQDRCSNGHKFFHGLNRNRCRTCCPVRLTEEIKSIHHYYSPFLLNIMDELIMDNIDYLVVGSLPGLPYNVLPYGDQLCRHRGYDYNNLNSLTHRCSCDQIYSVKHHVVIAPFPTEEAWEQYLVKCDKHLVTVFVLEEAEYLHTKMFVDGWNVRLPNFWMKSTFSEYNEFASKF